MDGGYRGIPGNNKRRFPNNRNDTQDAKRLSEQAPPYTESQSPQNHNEPEDMISIS